MPAFLSPHHHELVSALRRSATSWAWVKEGMDLMRHWRAARARLPAEPTVVAHESAHLVLGHCDVLAILSTPGGAPPNSQREAAADALAAEWGFKRSYLRARLQRMRQREEGLAKRQR